MIYFTSDLHLSHTNIIRYNDRPFRDVVHMNHVLIDNINSKVKLSDEVYILGDFAFCNSIETTKLLNKINCKNIYLLKGNHDGFTKEHTNTQIPVKWIKMYHELRHNGYVFILFHYPILVWNKKHFGAIHLYGHCHTVGKESQIPEDHMKNAFNMNCECWNYFPVSIEEIIKLHDPTANLIEK